MNHKRWWNPKHPMNPISRTSMQVYNSIRSPVSHQVRSQVGDQAYDQVWFQLRRIEDKTGNQVQHKVERQIKSMK